MSPSGELLAECRSRSRPRSRPVRMATLMPAAAASGAMVLKMLARQDFGRRHQRRLAAAFDHGRGGEQRHHGLAGADVALQQPQHAFGLGEIGDDVGDRARLRRRQRIGQRLDQLLPQMCPVAGGRRGRRGGADARAPARARAGRPGTRHRPAATTPTLSGSDVGGLGRPVQHAAARRRRPGSARARPSSGPAIPADRGTRVERGVDGLAHLIEAEPFGQRIDRLDQRQLRQTGLGDDAVGMHHLPHVRRRARPCPRRSAARRPAGAFPGSPCAR